MHSKTKAIVGGTALGIVILGGIGACVGPSKDQAPVAAPAGTVTAPAVTAPTVTVTQAPAAPVSPAEPIRQEPAATSVGATRVTVPMPDVVGMNLQAAQDLIQTQGVFYSRSEDATGAGRMQILDRDWVVVDQQPAAGEPIGEGDALLYVKKIGE